MPYQVRTGANDCINAARTAGFYPETPRIPIQIELKDFAQWFGQRKENQGNGVLTYLTEKIEVGIEQQVRTGTIKRALGTQSWVVIFDGLDEVPSDVKDAVSEQVCHFVDEVSIACKCDLLTVCTSRPQGYSGQFSTLETAIIDLVELSPSQALLCAKPVVSIDRTEIDVQQFMKILTDAIQSASVRQLMTTPLQSHIMAVLVRNGDRPPERRWQLFTNFYQVIKRRETNRRLPDKKLEKLFREGDHLLKTVHNRLGFVLHARAETSKGAQTQLRRDDEFKSLVTGAVAQMIEENTDDIVTVLMEATTDRLVLVNTPDNGNYVRYDVRPLQEFFAAEFLYESVNADQLGQRVEIIRGDAHWREVIHFLLSALVEDKRTTELTVVVDVLARLDEEANGSYLRLLPRRLGRGALLVARLLNEGVLEQDKRVRELFRKCLEPLSACVLLDVLEPLLRIRQPNTRAWLCNVFADRIKDASEAESIGAAIVLSYILPDDNPRTVEVRDTLLSASASYLSTVLEVRERYSRMHREDSLNLSADWVLDLCIKVLTNTDFVSINTDIVRTAITILKNNKEKSVAIARSNGMSDAHIALLELSLKGDSGDYEEECGLLKVGRYTNDWTTGKCDMMPIDEVSDATGVLQLIYRILRFGKTHAYDDFIAVQEFLEQNGIENYHILPDRIIAYIPHDILSSNQPLLGIGKLSKDEFDELMREKALKGIPIRKPWTSLTLTPKYNEDDFLKILESFPEVALDYITSYIFEMPQTTKRSASKKAFEALFSRVLQQPELLLRISHAWGLVSTSIPDRQEEFRQALHSVADKPVVSRYWNVRWHLLNIQLPQEALLLPHLLNTIMHSTEFTRSYKTVMAQAQKHLKSTKKLIHQTIDDAVALKQTAEDSQLSPLVRGSAALMYILHPNGDSNIGYWQQTLVAAYSPDTSSWFLDCFATTILLVSSENDLETQIIVAKLLELSRNDYKGKQSLERLLAVWREVSHTPIQKAGVEDQWLNVG